MFVSTTKVAPQTRRRPSGVVEDCSPSSNLCTQDPAPRLMDTAPQSQSEEEAVAGTSLGLEEPRDKHLTQCGLRKRARLGEAEVRAQAPVSLGEPPFSWDLFDSAVNGSGTKRFLRPFPAGHSRTPTLRSKWSGADVLVGCLPVP